MDTSATAKNIVINNVTKDSESGSTGPANTVVGCQKRPTIGQESVLDTNH